MILFAKPFIDRMLVMKWATCSKHMTVPKFLKANRSQLRFNWPLPLVDNIIRAGDDWLNQCVAAVTTLQQQSGLGDIIFAPKMKDLVGLALATTIQKHLNEKIAAAIRAKTVCGKEEFKVWRTQIADAVDKEVASLSILPSRRDVCITYRSSEITGVAVSCVVEHIELSIISAFKSAAVAAEFLPPLDAEIMLGFSSTALDRQLLVQQDFFAEAATCLFLLPINLKNLKDYFPK